MKNCISKNCWTKAWPSKHYQRSSGSFIRSLIERSLCGTLFFMVCTSVAFAGGPLQLDMTGKLVAEEATDDGQPKEKLVDLPEKVLPGNVIEYTIAAQNLKDGILKEVDIIGKIPEGTGYLDESASEIPLFSIDDGKTYMPAPVTYTVIEDGREVEKIATPDMYTQIKWIVKILQPGETPTFTYRVAVK